MIFSPKTLIYQAFIDPILANLHSSVLLHVEPSHRVIDIACGTGALALAIARKASHVTGIDLSEEAIAAAQRTADRRGTGNVLFETRDAGDLSCFRSGEFDIAVTSMAVHQFDAGIALKILSEMRRISRRVIIIDYNHLMPGGWRRSTAWGMEFLAGGDHYRNFRIFMQRGGISHFIGLAEMTLTSEVIRGGGVFVVARCDTP
jgi:SAM-dependent methyltransferase